MAEQSRKTPRRADTGSYPGTHRATDGPSGRYTRPSAQNDETRRIPVAQVRAASRAAGVRQTAKRNKERQTEKFNFGVLFSKKNMRAWRSHLIFYGIVITVSLLLAAGIIAAANDINAFVAEDESVTVLIPQGSSTKQIGTILKENDLVDSVLLFQGYCKLKKADGKFQYGEYQLNTNMSYKEMVRALKKSSVSRETATVTIPEGYEQQQIIDLLVSKKYADRDKLERVMNEYEFDYEFLKDIPARNNRLEGYLFPDTYEIFVGDEVSIVKKMLDNFESKISDQKIQTLIKNSDYSLDELITLASVVEREGAKAEELPRVASVFYNRLNNKQYPYLESCATVQYILPERKTVLSIADTKVDNPYNTYQNRGLPPGPIACPGLSAIKAVLEPEDTDYFYFVATSDGTHLFGKTYNEHLSNIRKAGSGQTGTGTVSE